MVRAVSEPLFIVRLWDGMDGTWMDVSDAVSAEEANAIWNEKTSQGTKHARYQDIDYYRIFPAETVMLWSEGREQSPR